MSGKYLADGSSIYTDDESRTVPFDARFPNQNQTKHCFQNYLDYHRCHKKYGDDHEPCEYFKWAYRNLCPSAWHEKWDEQREKGTFTGNC